MILRQIASRVDRLRPYNLLERPIFILSAPRSGSTFLFDILCRFEGVWAWHAETDAIWWSLFPYDRSDDLSDFVGAGECTPWMARRLRREFYRHALWARAERGQKVIPREHLGTVRIRYLDKTIANCFHLGFLERAFPDALYILLVRDGRATISSMMEGWHDPERFVKDGLQPYLRASGSDLPHWSYPAPPGWQNQIHRPLEEVCAWSWRQHIQSVVDHLEQVPDLRKLLLRYEHLAEDPIAVAERVGRFCNLEWGGEVVAFAEARPLSRTTVSAPDPDKWRRKHGRQIERIIPTICDLMQMLGYSD